MFALHLHTCNLGTHMRESKNPFTGAVFVVPNDLGRTSLERDAVRALLEEVGASNPDPDTYCNIAFPDSSSVSVAVGNLYSNGPCTGFALEYDRLTPAVASFVHALAVRGNLSIISGVEPTVAALPLFEQRERVLSRWPGVQVVESALDLETWLRQNLR